MRRALSALLLLAVLVPVVALPLAGGEGEAGWPLRNSLLTALAAALAATLLGTAAGIGLRARFAGRAVAVALLALPPLLPPVIPGAALLLVAERTGYGAGRPALVLWHVLLAAPLVAAIVWAALGRADPAPLRTAAACGVPPALAVRRLLRPRLLRAMAAGAALAFALSIGESSLAVMLGAETLPMAVLPGGAAAGSLWPVILVAVAVAALILLRPWPGTRRDRGEATVTPRPS